MLHQIAPGESADMIGRGESQRLMALVGWPLPQNISLQCNLLPKSGSRRSSTDLGGLPQAGAAPSLTVFARTGCLARGCSRSRVARQLTHPSSRAEDACREACNTEVRVQRLPMQSGSHR